MNKGRSTLAVAQPSQAERAKLRKRLQKIIFKRKTVGKPDASIASRPAVSKHQRDTNKSSSGPRARSSPLPPPDLSDPKWSEYVRNGSLIFPLDASSAQPFETVMHQAHIIPEFSHLALQGDTPRTSLEKLSSLSSPLWPESTTSSGMRRHAKTPIHTIGQLEGAALQRPCNTLALRKMSSVERIADQRQVLLQSPNSMPTDACPEPRRSSAGDMRSTSSSVYEDDWEQPCPKGPRTDETPELSSRFSDVPSSAPTSACTLVAFDDETVYFKPISFVPEPLSGRGSLDKSQFLNSTAPSPAPTASTVNNLSLQICLDLLTRELKSVTSSWSDKRSPSWPSPEASALQIWVMIEAYETLKDRLLEMDRLPGAERATLELMLDVWLRALYAVHDRTLNGLIRAEREFEALRLGAEDVD